MNKKKKRKRNWNKGQIEKQIKKRVRYAFGGCRMHWLLLCRGVRPPHTHTNEYLGYDTKQSHGEVPVMLELWGMPSTPSLPSLPGLLYFGVVAPDRVLSMGQIELNRTFECSLFFHLTCVFMLNMINWITWKRTVLTFKLRTYAKLNCLK